MHTLFRAAWQCALRKVDGHPKQMLSISSGRMRLGGCLFKSLILSAVLVLSIPLVTSNNAQAKLIRSSQAQAPVQELDFRGKYNLVDGPSHFSDSGIEFPAYADIENHLAELAKKYPSFAQVVHYGKSVGGRSLTLLRIADASLPQGTSTRPAIEISGAIHGNEYLGIEEQLAAYFLEHRSELPGLQSYLAKGGVIYFIPVVNPDGLENRARLNENVIDLNRDFDMLTKGEHRFTQPESTLLARYLETIYRPISFNSKSPSTTTAAFR